MHFQSVAIVHSMVWTLVVNPRVLRKHYSFLF